MPASRRPRGFRIALEDDDLVAVDKDPGVLTVPAPSSRGTSLVDRLLEMYRARGFRRPRLWVVHRIDRFTSGLVIFARREAAAARLIESFRRRSVLREYLAICHGVPRPAAARLVSRLVESRRTLKLRVTSDPGKGKVASCVYTTERVLTRAALLRVTLETGLRNQIRVQLAAAGHPLVGDRAYGESSPLIRRVALHAARLAFDHPSTGRRVALESPLPEDMARLVDRLSGRLSRLSP
jgi:23S rRNA pseudouridine1911/1915/1917 synthase